MLGLGWTEMLVIGLAALIFIGPKDLPVVMNRVGKVIGQIRRMGNEFQREINKTTGLDEVRNLRNSLTSPLKKTAEEIRREFNTITPTGQKPSGIIKPADPKVESVVDEIKAAAGIAAPAAAAAPLMTATEAVAAPKKAPAKPKAPVKAKAAPTRPVITTQLAPLPTETAKAAAPNKPAVRKTAVKPAVAEVTAPAEAKPATAKRVAAKPAAAAKPKAAPKPKAAAKPKPPATEAKAGNQ